jgi:cytochrome c oxidase subunit 3
MSAVATQAVHHRLKFNRLGLWLFFVSEVFLFGGLLVMRFHLWGNTRPDLDQRLGLTVTSILLLSSFFMNRAEMGIAHDDRRTFLWGLMITGALGLVFLVGVMAFEWGLVAVRLPWEQGIPHPLRPTDGVYGSVLYAMTGLHALHVLSGVVFIGIVWAKGRRGEYSSQGYWGVEACAIYWHFVDVVWVFFYPALYLMGTVAR